jgi:hypothetical protein
LSVDRLYYAVTESPETLAGVSDVDCTGLQALVTGSTSGIGRAAALALGRLGADVVVHGRDPQAGAAVVEELSRTGADATFVQADFADLDAVRDFAAAVREESDGLDLLVNNAGGLFRDGELTDAGVEYTFHVNHLSPYLLTADLLNHLHEDARIVTTASDAHKGASLDIERVRGADRYTGFRAYSHSKLANILFTKELARRLDASDREVTANSIHPGAIPGSGFSRFLPRPLPGLFQRLEAVPGVTSRRALRRYPAGTSRTSSRGHPRRPHGTATQPGDSGRRVQRYSASTSHWRRTTGSPSGPAVAQLRVASDSPSMSHDRIHAREPAHHRDRWSVGTIASVAERDGHCVVTVTHEEGETIDLVVTLAVRDLFVSRLDIDEGESPVGEPVWYRKHGSHASRS